MPKKEKISVFESPLKLDSLSFKKRDNIWRAKISVKHVDQMHDSMKAKISLNPAPLESEIENIENQIERSKTDPSLFGKTEKRDLEIELKDAHKDLEEKTEAFGEIEFQTTIEALAQKTDGHTSMTIFVPRDVIADFMEKVNLSVDEKAQIEFYI